MSLLNEMKRPLSRPAMQGALALWLGAASALAIASPALAQDDAQPVVGRNSAVLGTVTIASMGEDARPAVVKDDVRLGDLVASQASSKLQVLLLDETVFTVGESAELTIDEFVYNPNSNNNKMTASVKKGMFRFMSGKVGASNPENVAINTPIASLGIRGTIVEGLVGAEALAAGEQMGLVDPSAATDADNAVLFVLRGPGPNNVGDDRRGLIDVDLPTGTFTVDEPGQAVFLQSLDADPEIFALSDAGFGVFSGAARTVPVSNQSFGSFTPPDNDLGGDTDDGTGFEPDPLPLVDDVVDPLIDIEIPEEDPFDNPCGPDF